MTKKDIDTIIEILCPNDEDFEKPIISPQYLKQELEQLALEQEPCNRLKLDGMLEDAYEHGYQQARHDYEVQPCEEAVSKRAVLDAIKNNYRMAAIDVIEKLPPVTPARIKGKWIKQKIGYGCSNCTLCTNDYGVGIYKYCPNCGADMREGISE